jgi:TrmH family RNA methyltransferase
MGAIFAVPVARAAGPADLPGTTIALAAREGAPLTELLRDLHGGHVQDATVLIGSERDGLPDELVKAADRVAHIPIATHSLNAAMAATVALYELGHRMRLA